MKKKIGLFFGIGFALFAALSVVNILKALIYGYADGSAATQIAELPYLFYLGASFAASLVYFLFSLRKK